MHASRPPPSGVEPGSRHFHVRPLLPVLWFAIVVACGLSLKWQAVIVAVLLLAALCRMTRRITVADDGVKLTRIIGKPVFYPFSHFRFHPVFFRSTRGLQVTLSIVEWDSQRNVTQLHPTFFNHPWQLISWIRSRQSKAIEPPLALPFLLHARDGEDTVPPTSGRLLSLIRNICLAIFAGCMLLATFWILLPDAQRHGIDRTLFFAVFIVFFVLLIVSVAGLVSSLLLDRQSHALRKPAHALNRIGLGADTLVLDGQIVPLHQIVRIRMTYPSPSSIEPHRLAPGLSPRLHVDTQKERLTFTPLREDPDLLHMLDMALNRHFRDTPGVYQAIP